MTTVPTDKQARKRGESAFRFHKSCADKQRREGPKTRLRTRSVMRYCRPSVALLVSSSIRATWAKAGNAYRSGQGASCREPPRIASCNLRPRAWGREDMRTSMQQPSSGANGIRGQMWTWTLENRGETRERGQAVGGLATPRCKDSSPQRKWSKENRSLGVAVPEGG